MDVINNQVIMNQDYTPEILKEIALGKRLFFEKDENPNNIPYLCPEVAESWIRSKRYGVNPYKAIQQKKLEKNKIRELLIVNKMLLQTAIPFIRKFKPFLSISNYMMSLTDKSGIALFSTGDRNDVEHTESLKGSILFASNDEEIVGTTSTHLSILHKIPVQLIGPNNYLAMNENDIASSAPILNSDNEVMGTLLIIQFGGDLSREKKNFDHSHTLGWVTSMSKAIASLLEIKLKNQLLETAYKTLDTTLTVIGQGFITLDSNGIITNINKKAVDMLGFTANDNIKGHYTKYFGKDQNIKEALQKGCTIHDMEISIGEHAYEQRYIYSIDPIWNNDNTKLHGAVISISQSSRIDKLIGNRGGFKAHYTFGDIKGKSGTLLKSLNFAKQISKSNANILLIGESGTGKELFAQAIHNSYCLDGPFIAINCASMPRTLIESELFGYEGGAFTGAEKKGRPGKFELANGGTIFLDEIGDMPIEIQPVLLRVLEEKQMMRLGGTKYIPVDVRIIAATNKNLFELTKNNQFREDLYFRLAVFKLEIPPLRKRENDVLFLAEYFVESTCRKIRKRPPVISEEARKSIGTFSWPGNARQLENAIVHAVYMCDGNTIKACDLPLEITVQEMSEYRENDIVSLAELEKAAVEKTMRYSNNNTAKAAEILGIARTTLYNKLKEYSINY